MNPWLQTLFSGMLLATLAALSQGCASIGPKPITAVASATNAPAHKLAGPDLRQYLERELKQPIREWPLQTWEHQKLALAAAYFHSTAAGTTILQGTRSPADWQVRTNLRARLFVHAAARRRLDLLNDLSETQSGLIRIYENRVAARSISWRELTPLHTQQANTFLERLDALQIVMQSRPELANAIGVPVSELVRVEVTYDFSSIDSNTLTQADLRQQALRNRPDVRAALTGFDDAETALRREMVRRFPEAAGESGLLWDQQTAMWIVQNKAEGPPQSGNQPQIVQAEEDRTKSAERLIGLQAHIMDDIDRRLVAHLAAQHQVQVASARLERERKLHHASAWKSEKGATNLLAVLSARLRLAQAALDHFEAVVTLHETLMALEDTLQESVITTNRLLSRQAKPAQATR